MAVAARDAHRRSGRRIAHASGCCSRRARCPISAGTILRSRSSPTSRAARRIRLRADIFWAARRWREAAEQIELLLRRPLEELRAAHRRRSAPTSCAPRSAMRWPRTALGLVAAAREICGEDGARGRIARAFDVVTAAIGTAAPEFRDIAQIVGDGRHARRLPARHPRALSGDAGALIAESPQPARRTRHRAERPIRQADRLARPRMRRCCKVSQSAKR